MTTTGAAKDNKLIKKLKQDNFIKKILKIKSVGLKSRNNQF